MAITTGILLFEDFEELDAVGPWEVFTVARQLFPENRVVTIARTKDPVRAAKGMRVLPDHSFADAPALDVLLVPGGQGTRREVGKPELVDWLRKAGAQATWVTSVCTGALLLHEAGFAKGKRVTTHWGFVDQLRARGDVEVLDHVRWVRDGNLVTSAGISAGIDMALWLVGQIHDPESARKVQRIMEYDPAPPYAAEV
ncbi:MAG TPA: DJ-1/PfpI family protein [Myxococcota bacterium]|nr:DJ-1/PfpI family protein [Myxococcota bacterium]